ncbi:MAG: acetylxylan esterase [Armatimonadetes bacterium]|nr:acetylxylan esterase [Armatimonadota bacterium]
MLLCATCLGASLLLARPISEDEANVPAYALPPVLVASDGSPVRSAEDWVQRRRPEVMELFRSVVYGRTPAPAPILAEVVEQDSQALGGRATRRQVTIYLLGRRDGPFVDLLVYSPNHVQGKAPAFLGLNFDGNQATTADPAVRLARTWHANGKPGFVNNRATEATRGTGLDRWPIDMILARGFAVATAYYGDIEPDHAEGWKTGLRAAMSPQGAQTAWKQDDWGAIGAWSYGLSRCLDYLQTLPDIDGSKVSVIGHSRLGKTSLWAGAQDERFAMVVSNDSGEGGAALTRRCFGESLARITTAFPHWFAPGYARFADREHDLPVDFHELIALCAPRPCYIASATEDKWADPKGEFLSGVGAGPVYSLFGLSGLGTETWPAPATPVGESIGYHLRIGKHDITEYDWDKYLAFAERHLVAGHRAQGPSSIR